jgi:hypothetical protein
MTSKMAKKVLIQPDDATDLALQIYNINFRYKYKQFYQFFSIMA